jgi:DNA-binding protein HU-beta
LPTDKGGNVTKQEFIDRVAGQTGLSKRDATEAVEAVLGTIKSTLSSGGEISFTGFGKFHVAVRGPRQGVNPQTKERIMIPGGKVPRFTAGSSLKEAVKSG